MRTAFGVIFLIWGAGLGAAGQYAKVSVVYHLLPDHYPDAGLGLPLLVSIVGFVGILFGVVAGLLAATLGFRRILLWGLCTGSGLSLVQALMPPLPLMLGLRALEGAAHLAIVVAAPTLISQLSLRRHRGFTLTLWSTFFGVAYTGLVWLGLPLVAAHGIPALFAAHGAWMAAFACALWLVLPKDAAPPEPTPLRIGALLKDHGALYQSASLSAPAIGWFFYTFCFLAILTLIPPFIDEGHRAAVMGAMPLVSILVSMSLGVWLLRYCSAVQVVIAGFGLTVLSLIWQVATPGAVLACGVLAAAFGLVQGASFAAVPQLNATAEDQARANGAMAQMGNVGNTLGTPVLALVLAGAGFGAMIWTAAVITALGIAVHLWLAHRRMFA